ncbi:pantoate--beta-alanine ligase [Rhodoplanes roseus]|uniref:Pantothenate synthetase n=1 Tax=Rhodoplanes roseus TaxID=29409 RepID=A0A327KZ50_9BRAD|nr:pantoate--beta-alanine ligase [Rhodoplanes roseus]RAI42895.1 pantoate--beta-alanine ligase [Rhodoplanes roseus]
MKNRLAVVRTLKALDRALAPFRDKGESVALVPTMGALHAGHLALVRHARRKADRVVVSIFVNPTQFAPTEDFSSYPRRLAADVDALAGENVDLVWAPDAAVMYPDGFATRIAPEGPALAGLEDKFRPHFFGGVATVVAKLFGQVRPDVAVFGQKDYQQLKVVTRLAADLDLRVAVVGMPTVREKDGLALSSRNQYLSAEERARAPALHRVLAGCAEKIAAGRPIKGVMESARKALTRDGFAVDYVEARHAETLAPVKSRKDGPIRLLVAAKLGTTRLIDNLAV